MTARADVTRQLLAAPPRALARILAAGHPFDPAALAGWLYRGTSLGLPAWLERLTWKKFAKAFDRDARGRLHGWNVRCEQDGLDQPWRPQRRGARAVTFGPFDVVVTATGVVLDYRAAAASAAAATTDRDPRAAARLARAARAASPLRTLRDPLVALTAGSTELLLGRSLVDLGVTTLGTPSYFVLERGERVADDLRPAASGDRDGN